MDKDELQEMIEGKVVAGQQLETMRAPVTILFSDIKGSSAYFEKKGDVAGMAMLQRHHDLLFPSIELHGGRVVKTIGDAIMACFDDPTEAIKAAVAMQCALERDRKTREREEQIHIRIGLHKGLGLVKDNDVYGDVVNAASRVEHQTKPDQILITDVLLDAARAAGFQCANFGHAEMPGKEEAIELYAVAWSEEATEQLLTSIQARYEAKLREAKRLQDHVEEEFDRARDQWRNERRKLSAEIENLEQELEQGKQNARAQASTELHAVMEFQLGEATREKKELQQQLEASEARWQQERNNLKAQIASMQASLIDVMERSNNPARIAATVREQVEARLAEAKKDWQFQWEAERRQLLAEIDRLKKSGPAFDDRREVAKRAVLEKLGKLPPAWTNQAPKTNDPRQKEFEDSKIQWETERDQLTFKIEKLQRELQRSEEVFRSEILQEVRTKYDLKLAEAERARQDIEQQLQSVKFQRNDENQALKTRVQELEQALPAAQEATRRQVEAELRAELENKLQDANRLKTRAERRLQDVLDEIEAERRKSQKQIRQLEEQIKEAKGAAFRAQRSFRPASTEGE